MLVEHEHDEFTIVDRFFGKELDFKTCRQVEHLLFFFGRTATARHIIIILSRGCHRCRFGLRTCGDLRPRHLVRRGGEFFNKNVFSLNHRFATRGDLNPNLTVRRQLRVRFSVIQRRHPIHPSLNMTPFATDAIFVPARFFHGGKQSRGI